jgi:membrane protein DedA with SNARE-associated domain
VDDLGGRSGRLLRGTRTLLSRRGPSVLVAARFVPGGRVAATMASGYVRYPLRAFLQGVGAGAALWAAYSTGVGYLGGHAFDEPWMGIAAGFAIALTCAGLMEGARRYSASSSVG